MSLVHIHLIMNHLPILGIPIVAIFLLHAIWKGNVSSQKFALLGLVVLAILVLPVYFTGEPAEDAVEKLPGVVKSMIHDHEEAGEVALVLALLTGAAALLNLWLMQINRPNRMALWAVLLFAAIATGSLAYTGNLGGLVRHTEIRSGNSIPGSDAATAIRNENTDQD